jgi:hypothetical protein
MAQQVAVGTFENRAASSGFMQVVTKKFLFIDRNSEISEADVKAIEEAGCKVILITGNPHDVLNFQQMY